MGRLASRGQLASGSKVDGERLLAEHGDAPREEVQGNLGVGGGRRANEHGVDRRAVSQLLPRTECLAAQGFGGAGRRIEANIGHRRDTSLFEAREDLEVGLGDARRRRSVRTQRVRSRSHSDQAGHGVGDRLGQVVDMCAS